VTSRPAEAQRVGLATGHDGQEFVVPRQRGMSRRHREWLAAALFLLPDVAGLFIFVGIPMVLALAMGFFEVNGFGDYRYIGLDNYRAMFNDDRFLRALWVTFLYVITLVPGLYVAGLLLALLVKQKLPWMPIWRGMLFLPNVISLVVIGLVWNFLLVDRIGILNRFVVRLGLDGQSWLGDPAFALWAVVGITIWFLMGYYMLIFLAGLQEIPPEYYEAARLDGAGPLRQFRDITFPLLRPTSFFVILTLTVTAVAGGQGFDLVYVLTRGGPDNSTTLVVFYIYQQAFQFGAFGYAAAIASFLVLILLIMTAILFVATKGGRFDFD
jgi:multiple sugar transport system permease protein